MSQENVALISEFMGRINQFGQPEGWVHPEVEWHLDSGHPDQRVLHGEKEVADYFRGWFSSFDGIRMDVADYIDRGDYVVAPLVVYGRPRGSAAELRLRETWTFKVLKSVIVEVREYLTLDDALKDVDLAG
jgi:ketosteroid isomerase-like protein